MKFGTFLLFVALLAPGSLQISSAAADPARAYQTFTTDEGVKVVMSFRVDQNSVDGIDYWDAVDVRFEVSGGGVKSNDLVAISLENQQGDATVGFQTAFESGRSEDRVLGAPVPISATGRKRFSARQRLKVWISGKAQTGDLVGNMHETARMRGLLHHR